MKLTRTPNPFAYPLTPIERKHGPLGYKNYESYREWVRDDFAFRCVFCLRREQWEIIRAIFAIDHFIAQCRDSLKILDYDNLLYICSSCNATKSHHVVCDPCKVALGKCLVVHKDGTITATNEDGQLLIDVLRLDNEDYTRFRYMMIRTIHDLADNGKEETLLLWLSYPENLPDLIRLRPPKGNKKPEGIRESHYARRFRGELPKMY
jgi:hypothetical protein